MYVSVTSNERFIWSPHNAKTNTQIQLRFSHSCTRRSAFSALMLLVGRQEGHLACKNSVVRYWRGYRSGARCKWFAYGSADATVTSSSLAPVKSRMVYLSGASLPRLSWKKRPLNGCSSSISCWARKSTTTDLDFHKIIWSLGFASVKWKSFKYNAKQPLRQKQF